jgi:hypothetical protein
MEAEANSTPSCFCIKKNETKENVLYMYQCHTHLPHKPLDLFNHPFPLPHASIHALPMGRISQTHGASHSEWRHITEQNENEISHISDEYLGSGLGKICVFWDVGDVWFGNVYRHFGRTCCFHSQVQNVSKLQSDYAASHPMRQLSS